MKKINRIISFCTAFMVASTLLFTGCGGSGSDGAKRSTGSGESGNASGAENSTLDDENSTADAENGSSYAYDKASEHVDADSFTLMVYICGADLESENGAATADINEMLYSDAGENLNIVIQTGGASEWQNSVISADSVQRYAVSSEGIELLDDCGQAQVTSSDMVGDFISFAMEERPADRYGIIFWDHGGGTMGGYGCDENYDDEEMNISQLADGLEMGGCHFDFIGFDCCLMATLVNAVAVSPYADYMIASEETEPGTGWYYTNFLSEIEYDPGISMIDLATTIINDFTDEENTYLNDGVTLSLIDLSQMDSVLESFYTYFSNSSDVLSDGGFNTLATARAGARSYGTNEFDQIDLIDYIDNTDVEGGDKLKNAVESAVLLNGGNISGSNGLALYYPYSYPDEYDSVTDYIESIGFDFDLYTSYFNEFMTIAAGGQASGGNSNPFSSETASSVDYSEYDWFDADLENQYEESDAYSYVDSSDLEITEKDDGYVLQLSDEDWDIVSEIELQVYADDGEGYLALGSDNLFDFDEDGDLIIDYDYTWLYLNDSIVSYYVKEVGEYKDGTTYSLGYIPAVLNDETDINIWLLWDNATGDVEIEGYQVDNEDSSVSQRGYRNFKDGDVIDFYFDYYTYDGAYDAAYFLGDNSITYSSSEGLEVGYYDIGDINTEICFWLKDIYGNEYWTEPLYVTVE